MAEILLHGVTYEIPESFTLREMRIVERYTDGHAAQEGYELSKIAATIHIAIARAKPATSFDEIQAVVDDLPVEDLEGILSSVDSAGQSPPAQSSSESSESSSDDSASPSEPAQESETQETSGSQDLDGFRSFHAMSGN